MRQSESAPPHNTAFTVPARIQSAPMPSALAPDEHAVEIVRRGPRLPMACATRSVEALIGVANQSRSADVSRVRYASSPIAIPPVVVPSSTPTPLPSRSPAVRHASSAAVSAIRPVRATPRTRLRGAPAGGTRSWTSAAMVERKPALGNTVSSPMPQRPSCKPSANASTPTPSALMLPAPVIAMRTMSERLASPFIARRGPGEGAAPSAP